MGNRPPCFVGEGATQAANIFADIAVMAEKSDWHKNIQHYLNKNPDWDYRQAKKEAFIDAALQVGEASLGGGISGSIMGSAYAKIQSTTDDVRENPTSRSIVQPNAITQTATNQVNTSINPSDVAKSLRSKGVYSRKVDGLAEAIAARLNGQELTRSQRSLLNIELGSPTVQSVISEFMQKKANGVDSAQSRIYDGTNNVPNEISQNSAARNVGQLDAIVQAANNQANASANQISTVGNPGNTATNQANTVALQEEVAKSLRNKGAYSKEVDGIAEAIVATLNGREPTRLQQSILSSALNSSAVWDTISEYINRKKTTMEQHSLEQRHQVFPETAVLPEQYDRFLTWEHRKLSEKTRKVFRSIEKMARSSSRENDWTKTSARIVSKTEKSELVAYAAERGIKIPSLKNFDGDPALLRAEIDALSSISEEFPVGKRLVLSISHALPDEEFASTVGEHITINAKALRDRATTEYNLSNGGLFASSKLEDIVRHEYGHVFSSNKGNRGIEITRTAVYNISGEDKSVDELLGYLHTHVSPYSTAFQITGEKPNLFGSKKYKEIIPEVLVKNKNTPDEFTEEFIRILKELL